MGHFELLEPTGEIRLGGEGLRGMGSPGQRGARDKLLGRGPRYYTGEVYIWDPHDGVITSLTELKAVSSVLLLPLNAFKTVM